MPKDNAFFQMPIVDIFEGFKKKNESYAQTFNHLFYMLIISVIGK